MKKWIVVISLIEVLISSCKKQDLYNERINASNGPELILRPRFPPGPRTPLHLSKCISSYQDFIDLLGSNQVIISKVILESGAVIEPGGDIASISYEAINTQQPHSLFDSKLSIVWRWPDSEWLLSTAEVWSLGCGVVSQPTPIAGEAMQGYTNITKGMDTILVNTCFYWCTSVHTGEKVHYLLVD